MKLLIFLAIAILGAPPAQAQLAQRNQLGITMGHVHLVVKDVEAQKRFWISVMGGTLVKNGPLELIQFPGVFIMLRQGEASGPPAGTILNHFGFTVKDMPGSLAKWKEAGIKIDPTENPNEVYLNAPDGIRLEVYGEPALPTPVSMNHLHYSASDIRGNQGVVCESVWRQSRAASVYCVPLPSVDDRGRRHAGCELVLRGQQYGAAANQRAVDRSHWLRRQQSRGIRREPRSQRDQDGFAGSSGAEQQRQSGVPDRPLWDLHRTDRGSRASGVRDRYPEPAEFTTADGPIRNGQRPPSALSGLGQSRPAAAHHAARHRPARAHVRSHRATVHRSISRDRRRHARTRRLGVGSERAYLVEDYTKDLEAWSLSCNCATSRSGETRRAAASFRSTRASIPRTWPRSSSKSRSGTSEIDRRRLCATGSAGREGLGI